MVHVWVFYCFILESEDLYEQNGYLEDIIPLVPSFWRAPYFVLLSIAFHLSDPDQ